MAKLPTDYTNISYRALRHWSKRTVPEHELAFVKATVAVVIPRANECVELRVVHAMSESCHALLHLSTSEQSEQESEVGNTNKGTQTRRYTNKEPHR